MFNQILRFGLFLSLVIYLPRLGRIDTSEVIASLILIFIVGLSLVIKPKREVSLKFLAFILFAILVACLFVLRFPTWRMLMNLIIGIMAIKVIAERIDLEYKSIGWILFGYAVLSDVLIFLQVKGLPNYFDCVERQVAGASAIPWVMGVSAILALPFIFRVNKYLVIVLLPMIRYSESIGCVVLFMIGMAYLLRVCQSAKVAIVAANIILLAGGLYFSTVEKNLDVDRVQAWTKSLQYMGNPVIGKGYGTWAHQGFTKKNGKDVYGWRWAHNEFFQHYFETGIIGLVFLFFWLRSLLRTRDRTARAAVGLLMLECMIHPVLHWPRLALISILIIAIAEASKVEGCQNTSATIGS